MGEKKYSILTESDIAEGIKQGIFQKENIELVRDKEGKIVKHLKRSCLEKTIIPPTLIQVNSTYVYQADIKPIIDAIIETQDIKLFEELEEEYQVVIDRLIYYRDHNDRLNDLNSKSLDASSIFEKRTERFLKNIKIDELGGIDIESCTTMLDSYINILFVYIISTYWIHKDKISNDTIAERKIEKLKKNVRYIYEQLLAQSQNDKGTERIPMHGSLYANYLLEDKNGIRKIEMLIKHDSRFSSLTDFMAFIQRCFLKKNDPGFNYQYNYQEPVRYEIDIRLDKDDKSNLDIKNKFVSNLFDILEKISILKNIYYEIRDAAEIDFDKIKLYENEEANNSLHLTAIPLALHSGR